MHMDFTLYGNVLFLHEPLYSIVQHCRYVDGYHYCLHVTSFETTPNHAVMCTFWCFSTGEFPYFHQRTYGLRLRREKV
jgi:hypothetical protein